MSKIEDALRRARAERQGDARAEFTGPEPRAARRNRPSGGAGAAASRGQLVGISAAEEIARMQEGPQRDRADLALRRIIDKNTADSRVADAFRHIRTQLFQKSAEKNFILLVSSVTSGGGASFVSLNLAAAIAFDEGKTAMVLDCNLQNPMLDSLIDTPEGAAGLTDYLSGHEPNVEQILHPIGIPRVRVIPVGRQVRAEAEYFTMPQLSQLLRSLRERYRERYIIVDAPPITEAADARILAELCDYTLLVVPYGRVTTAQVAEAAAAVDPEKLIGCVMNNEQRVPLPERDARARSRA